jgi:hypothetical protein
MNSLNKPVIKVEHTDSEVVVLRFIDEDKNEFFIEYFLDGEPTLVDESFDHAFGTEVSYGLDIDSINFDKIVYKNSEEEELSECPEQIKPYEISLESIVNEELINYFIARMDNKFVEFNEYWL